MEVEGDIVSCSQYRFSVFYRCLLISLIILIGHYVQTYALLAMMIKLDLVEQSQSQLNQFMKKNSQAIIGFKKQQEDEESYQDRLIFKNNVFLSMMDDYASYGNFLDMKIFKILKYESNSNLEAQQAEQDE